MKTNLVIACWGGSRAAPDPVYEKDGGSYIKGQLNYLNRYKHNLSQITFMANYSAKRNYNEMVDKIPKKIQGTPVKVIRRANEGISYGAYNQAFLRYRDQFDYYIFLEDDYVFCHDYFDEILVKLFNQKENCGYLCGLITWGLASISNGIASELSSA